MRRTFSVARNPDAASKLPYLPSWWRTGSLLRDPPLAEEWTYRFLGAALAHAMDEHGQRQPG